MENKTFYRGFSTRNYLENKNFSVTDIECVKTDLLNHIWTVKGERPMMPNFGTRIPLITFEPNDDETRSVVETDLRAVFEYDPRVQLLSLNVFSLPDNNAIIAMADLFYVELNITDTLHLEVRTQ